MSMNSEFGQVLRDCFKVQKEEVVQSSKEYLKTWYPPIFYDTPKEYQTFPSEASPSLRPLLCCPDGYFGADHPTNTWLVNLLKDTSEWRLQKALQSLRMKPLLTEDKFYQIIDRPHHYLGDSAKLDRPMFKSHSMLYLNAFGVALYLRADISAYRLASDDSSLVNPDTHQFASSVYDRDHDLVRFSFDFLCMKRENFKGLHYLAIAGWNPNSATLFTYRRKHYQYSVPFADWIDILRFMMEREPTINASELVRTMYRLEYVVNPDCNFDMKAMKEMGKVMIEPFELREMTKNNYPEGNGEYGYAGRKILRNKFATTPDSYALVFSDKDGRPMKAIRRVVTNFISYPRRLLTFQYYFDNENLFALPQIIRAVSCFKTHDFFLASQTVRNQFESDSSGSYMLYLDPLIFQVDYFLRNRGGKYKQWPNTQTTVDCLSEEQCELYYRFDTLNCLSLLTGILQNCLIKNMSQVIVENLCDLIVHILYDSDFLEAFFRYSYYDTYFGLTGIINCVPNLMSKTVLRLLKKLPITLGDKYALAELSRKFTPEFWQPAPNIETYEVPKTMLEMSDFLVGKQRRASMKTDGPATGEAMSGASSAGATGTVINFIRIYNEMEPIDVAKEMAGQAASETTRKQSEEKLHVAEYKQIETDCRYAQVFPSYLQAVDKFEVDLDELEMYDTSVRRVADKRRLATYRDK